MEVWGSFETAREIITIATLDAFELRFPTVVDLPAWKVRREMWMCTVQLRDYCEWFDREVEFLSHYTDSYFQDTEIIMINRLQRITTTLMNAKMFNYYAPWVINIKFCLKILQKLHRVVRAKNQTILNLEKENADLSKYATECIFGCSQE